MKTATVTTVSKGTSAIDEMPLRTKHLAAQFKIKATHLRRILRSMPEYADGVHTNYKWAEGDKRIPAIAGQIAKLAADKTERAKVAKAALDQRAAALAKQAQVDAKAVKA